MWASAHAQKIYISVSMVTAVDTPIFRENCQAGYKVPDNGGPDNRGSTVPQNLVLRCHCASRDTVKTDCVCVCVCLSACLSVCLFQL